MGKPGMKGLELTLFTIKGLILSVLVLLKLDKKLDRTLSKKFPHSQHEFGRSDRHIAGKCILPLAEQTALSPSQHCLK